MFWCVVDPLLLSAGLKRASSKRARKVNGNFLQCAAAVVKRNFHALQVKTVSRVRNKRNEEEVGVEAAQQPNSHNLLLFFLPLCCYYYYFCYRCCWRLCFFPPNIRIVLLIFLRALLCVFGYCFSVSVAVLRNYFRNAYFSCGSNVSD